MLSIYLLVCRFFRGIVTSYFFLLQGKLAWHVLDIFLVPFLYLRSDPFLLHPTTFLVVMELFFCPPLEKDGN